MRQLLEQAGVAGAPLADVRAHGWPAARLGPGLAIDHDIPPAAAEQAARMAQAILAGEGAWAWDAALIQTAINEAPLHYQGQSLRIDRLVQRRAAQADDALAGWWVLDYKSATQPQRQQALVAQLQRYREAVSVLMPGEVVHAAFLTGDGRMVMAGGAETSAASAVGHTSRPALRRWMGLRRPQRLPLPAPCSPASPLVPDSAPGFPVLTRASALAIFSTLTQASVSEAPSSAPATSAVPAISCDVAIIGGGPAGLMAAESAGPKRGRSAPVRRHAFGGPQVSAGGQGRAQSHAFRSRTSLLPAAMPRASRRLSR